MGRVAHENVRDTASIVPCDDGKIVILGDFTTFNSS